MKRVPRSGAGPFLYEQKGPKNSPRGKPLGYPRFLIVARLCASRGNSLSVVAVRCQIHLAVVRLPACERRDKQTCRYVPLNLFAAHGAVECCERRQRDCGSPPHKLRPTSSAALAEKFRCLSFRGPAGARTEDGLWWDCSVKQTCQWHVCSVSRSGYAARKPANSRTPRTSHPAEREVRNQRGFGGVLVTLPPRAK